MPMYVYVSGIPGINVVDELVFVAGVLFWPVVVAAGGGVTGSELGAVGVGIAAGGVTRVVTGVVTGTPVL